MGEFRSHSGKHRIGKASQNSPILVLKFVVVHTCAVCVYILLKGVSYCWGGGLGELYPVFVEFF